MKVMRLQTHQDPPIKRVMWMVVVCFTGPWLSSDFSISSEALLCCIWKNWFPRLDTRGASPIVHTAYVKITRVNLQTK